MLKPFRSLIAVSSLALAVALSPAQAQQAAPVAAVGSMPKRYAVRSY